MPRKIDRSVPIKAKLILPNPWNPYANKSDRLQDAIAESIGEFDQIQDVVVRPHPDIKNNKGQYQILDGEGRHRTFHGDAEIFCTVIHGLTDAQAKKITIVMDETRASADQKELNALLAELSEEFSLDELIQGLPYEEDYLSELISMGDGDFSVFDDPEEVLTEGSPKEKLVITEDEFEPSEDPEYIPRVKTGEIWRLGRHLVGCGDCTIEENVKALMSVAGVDGVDCVWTDPPYGVSYQGKTGERLEIANDKLSPSELKVFLEKAFSCCVLASGGHSIPCYVAHPAGELHNTFYQALISSGLEVKQTLVWVKNTFAMGRSDYHYQHEPIYYAATPGSPQPSRMGKGKWFGDHAQRSVFFFDKPNANRLHPTMKPIGLISAMLQNSAPQGGRVFDPFGGSGSTLISCEESGFSALILELDQKYASVICDRWESLTGLKAEKIGDLPTL